MRQFEAPRLARPPDTRVGEGLWVAVGLVLMASLLLSGCAPAAAPTCAAESSSCLRVLFLGNSYTYVNDLPGTFARLAQAGGHQAETGMVANAGETLSQHVASSETRDGLASRKWSYVVLQEQSVTPAFEGNRKQDMYPAARSLAAMVTPTGATPIFFMTWAHRDGEPGGGLPGYESMQVQIDYAYTTIANELAVPVAPVGATWFVTRRQHPEIGLWQDDGSHPSQAGTYLAACVFYATIYRQSPEGLTYRGGVSEAAAAALQAAAAQEVLSNPKEWNLR